MRTPRIERIRMVGSEVKITGQAYLEENNPSRPLGSERKRNEKEISLGETYINNRACTEEKSGVKSGGGNWVKENFIAKPQMKALNEIMKLPRCLLTSNFENLITSKRKHGENESRKHIKIYVGDMFRHEAEESISERTWRSIWRHQESFRRKHHG